MKDYLGYTGKVCVVTGAASGMGKATAEMLVDLGAMVYALDWAEVKVEGITAYGFEQKGIHRRGLRSDSRPHRLLFRHCWRVWPQHGLPGNN